ncbi:MAG TPA: hypothetical protein VMV48_14780 [Gallionellaceae bacterium]|nr:hypothetical protein [Gallionellaceae bacterium]
MSEQTNGLIDIVEPAMPVVAAGDGWLWIAVSGAVFVCVILVLFMLWKFKLPAYRALKNLRRMQQQLRAKEQTPHESVLMLALELRHALNVKRLLAGKAPQQLRPQDHARWTEFMQQLDVMLYQHDAELSEDRLATLFEQAKYWLRRYSRRSTLRKIGT